MKTQNILKKFLLSNPFYRGMCETVILVVTGICGLVFSWSRLSVFPVTNIFGVILIILAFTVHSLAEKHHKQAHEKSENIEIIVSSGIYAKIRHPLYLTLIIQNTGIAFAFGVAITFVLSLITIVHWILTALEEEKSLLSKFPDEYMKYKQQVKWRLIPGIF